MTGSTEFQKIKNKIKIRVLPKEKCSKLSFYAAYYEKQGDDVLVAVLEDNTKDKGYEIIHRSKMEKIWKIDRETLKEVAYKNTAS